MRSMLLERFAVLGAVILVCALAAIASAAGPDGPYTQARVEFDSMAEMESFMSLSHFDVMNVKPGRGVTIVTNPDEVEWIRTLGYDVTVEIEDMESFYASRVRDENFGDFHTYSETVDFLDALHASYPSITTEKLSIGTSIEGRTLWAMKISDNPEIDEGEPEVLFDGLHHAREPIGVEAIMHFMEWLCVNYGSDGEATFLVDEREIWFVPIVNPDGYVYNEIHDPNGGGMWRKNRRDNAGSSCFGVDPNRNYAYMWGTSGTSTDPCNDTYCGTVAASEPEVAAYVAFVGDHEFITNISFHSVVGAILIPWSHDNSIQTPDHDLFLEIANAMAQYNGYEVGRCGDILWYNCSGTTCDWLYAEHDIFSVCVEVGGTGFWPQESEIPSLRQECLWPQQYTTRIAGTYLDVESYYLFDGVMGNGVPDPGETVELSVTVQNQGLSGTASDVTVTLSSDDPYVQLVDASSSLGAIAARESASNTSDPFSFTVDAATPDAHGLVVTVAIESNGFTVVKDISWMIGNPSVLFEDDMEGGTGNWIESDGVWGLTVLRSHSPTHSYADSPTGNYAAYMNTWIELAQPLDLSNAAAADLTFWHRVKTEEDYDYCYVEASDDGGTTWGQVGPKYHGNNGTWEEVTLPLNDFTGTSEFSVRFRFTSDTYVTDDGWFIDDVQILGPDLSNAMPSAPSLVGPPNGGTVTTATPDLTVGNAIDTDPGDVLTYGFIVYDDELCTSVVATATGVAEGTETTSWTVGTPLADATYWWRSYADDGTERGPLMETGSFVVQSTGIDEGVVRSLVLHAASPNPFSRASSLSFELPVRTEVRFAIYGVDGRLVRTLVDGEAGPGPISITWDGRDDRGATVASGLYFARLVADDEVRHGKIVVLR